MTRTRGCGVRAAHHCWPRVPHGYWKTLTFLAGLRHRWAGQRGDPSPPGSNSSSCRRSAEADILIADNLGSHKGKAARDAIRSVGAKLFFLPTCSPDLNPIERVFAKLRTLLRKADERSIEATWQRIGDMLSASSAEECATYLRHTGYASIQA